MMDAEVHHLEKLLDGPLMPCLLTYPLDSFGISTFLLANCLNNRLNRRMKASTSFSARSHSIGVTTRSARELLEENKQLIEEKKEQKAPLVMLQWQCLCSVD